MKLRKKVFPIIAMLLVVFMAGCNKKDNIITGVAPKVTSTDPITDATSIAINSKISAIFSVGMDPSTITIENFTLQQGTTAVSGAVGYAGATATATFTPSSVLAAGTEYTATITTGAIDIDGTPLAKDYIWNFTTGGTLDLTKPTVTLTDPANSAIGVTPDKLIVITFSKPMDQATINSLTYTLKQGSTSVPGAVTYTGTKATFTPASNLGYSKIYTGTITTGAKDLAGNALAGNNTFSFTTGDAPDIIPPVVNSNDPLSDATGVALDKVVALTFSEPMDSLSVTTSFTLKQGETVVPGTVVYSASDSTATFTPTTPLTAGLPYTATIATGAKDLAGNALAANTVWAFTTLPPVASTEPINNVRGVALNKVVVLTFRVPMDPSTINETTLTLMQGTTPVPGTVTYLGNTATFTPTNPLDPSLPYTVTLTTGAKDLAGNAQAANTVWTFTTGTAASVVNPLVVDLKTAGDFGILSGTAVTNNAGYSEIHDMDIGLSPYARSYITGFPPAIVVGGAIYAADDLPATVPARLTQAKNDLIAAYDQAANATSPTPVVV